MDQGVLSLTKSLKHNMMDAEHQRKRNSLWVCYASESDLAHNFDLIKDWFS